MMGEARSASWRHANELYLMGQLALLGAALARYADAPQDLFAGAPPPAEPAAFASRPPAIEQLCAAFGLSSFERALVLLCAGVELDAAFAALCAAAHGDPQRNFATFGLAIALLPEADWAALSPAAPLRRWQIIQAEPGRTLTRSALRLDERVLHYLTGVQHMDERLLGLLRPLPALAALPPSLQTLADELAAILEQADPPLLQLCGAHGPDKRALASAACAQLGRSLALIQATAIPTDMRELDQLLRLWEREAILDQRVLLLDCDGVDLGDPQREGAIVQLVEALRSPLIVASRERRSPWQRAQIVFEVGRPAPAEQRGLWEATLCGQAARLNGQLDRLTAQFDMDAAAMQAAWMAAQSRLAAYPAATPEQIGAALWDACRVQSRPQLDELAQRIAPAAGWDDLVLPARQLDILHEAAMHVRRRSLVYERWGFAGKGAGGLGISALFAGASGTGKTMAAEVLARELHLDLYRIDLSAVVSKYIGETEKNLRRVFDAAEGGGAILLFDEADALFGKRSQVKDSHDRHANIEVGYLLQRMEAYRGLAILTTNLKDSLDEAFLRRIRFVVQFPFPDMAQRAAIWRQIFPAATPTQGLDAEKLAVLNVAGGNIRNIALHAAFLAADSGEPVAMPHVLRAARREYEKLERTLSEAELRGFGG